jgi:predicted transcriptional regulator
MKAVLISIQPKWCAKIANGEKTIEVRKSRPKLETPFKCYIYCTIGNGVKGDYLVPSGVQCGKVIGEFVCDSIDWFFARYDDHGSADLAPSHLIYGLGNANQENEYLDKCCLTHDELFNYIISSQGGDGYGWHITDLKIYDKPKELSEFYQECKGVCVNTAKKILCLKTKTLKTLGGCDRKIQLKRPFLFTPL